MERLKEIGNKQRKIWNILILQAKEINLKHVCDDNCNIYTSFDN